MKQAEMLLIAGADPNISNGDEPLLLWTLHGTIKTPGIRECEIEIGELLLKYNADVNNVGNLGNTALHYCANVSMVNCDDTSLIDLAKKLLATGADPNIQDYYGQIPLFLALQGRNIEMVEMLLEHSDLSLKDSYGRTALHAIEYTRNPVAAQFLTRLLELGLDKEAVCHEERTVLCETIVASNYECLKICIDAGCNVNVRNSDGETILQCLLWIDNSNCAAMKEWMGVAELLIDGGADVEETDGISMVVCAAILNYVEVVKKLLQVNCTVRMNKPEGTLKQYFDPCRFMRVALKEKAKDCGVFIFGDSCSTEDQHFFYDISHHPRAMLDGESIGLSRPPISLYRLSRRVVRSLLPTGPAFLPALNGLPLARSVQDFVALRP